MTPKQFERRISRLWRTQAAAAKALGLTAGAISHFCVGRREVPLFVVKFLQCLEEKGHDGD